MENHICKLCSRSFVNGKALGGHMRSHTMNFSSSSSEEEEDDKTRVLRLSFSVLQDRENKTDSSKKHPICRRSRRVGKSRISNVNRIKVEDFFGEEDKVKISEYSSRFVDHESFISSSLSDSYDEEDAAHCLIMLSKDNWGRDEIAYQVEEKENKFEDDDYSEDSGEKKVMKNKVGAKYYRCEICSKLFRSFQALGGHRASHNKIKLNTRDTGGSPKSAAAAVERTVACPFCPRVFTSGQAFGGHKRTHFLAATARTIGSVKPFSRNGECLNIDLNLPASLNDEFLMQN